MEKQTIIQNSFSMKLIGQKMKELKDVQDNYDIFLIHTQGVKESVTFYKRKEKRKKKDGLMESVI